MGVKRRMAKRGKVGREEQELPSGLLRGEGRAQRVMIKGLRNWPSHGPLLNV